MRKSRSYPENMTCSRARERFTLTQNLSETSDALHAFKHKDFERTQHLANAGLPSSRDLTHRLTVKEVLLKFVNYMLERGEEEQRQDDYILGKSYAGFYYFLKWFVRSVILTLFTIGGNILGKEVGCAIKSGSICDENAFILWANTPHLASAVCGSLSGLLLGQWIGRLIWDKSGDLIQKGLRRCEKWADRTKVYLILICIIVYIVGTISFGAIFWKFVDIGGGGKSEMLLGGGVGSGIGVIFAGLAYWKTSPCVQGQQTPTIRSHAPINEPPILDV